MPGVTKILILFAFVLLGAGNLVYGQKYTKLISSDSSESTALKNLIKETGFKTNYRDSVARIKQLKVLLLDLYAKGRIEAGFDSLKKDKDTLVGYIHLGPYYQFKKLSKGNADEEILSEARFKEKLFLNKPFTYKQISNLMEKVLTICENRGYPFAEVGLKKVSFDKGSIEAEINLKKGDLVLIDSVVVKGEAKISRIYLYNYLNIHPGDFYNESLIRQISNRIKELPFLKELKPFEVSFSGKKATLYLYLDNKKASQFDFIAGVLPDNLNPGRVIVTGEAHLKLQNSYGRGEIFELNWKSPLPKTQDLKIRLVYPFLFNTPFGLDGNFSLYKRDTTYLDVIKNLGIQYLLSGGNYFKVFITNKQSSLLQTKRFSTGTIKPNELDLSITSYGLSLKKEHLDYRINPREGYSVDLSGSVGKKQILPNTNIPAERYDSIQKNTTQYSLEYNIDLFRPIKGRSVFNLNLRGSAILGPSILKNELFRYGGLKTLRGFDEESILASSFHMIRLEYRYLLEQNSYLFAFYNTAYYENKSGTKFIYDTPYGFGSGITFETKLGLFSFTYALGKQFDNPLYLRAGKIHFGIISYF